MCEHMERQSRGEMWSSVKRKGGRSALQSRVPTAGVGGLDPSTSEYGRRRLGILGATIDTLGDISNKPQELYLSRTQVGPF